MDSEKILQDKIAGYKKVLVAFSGGVDSTFLLYMCKKVLGEENVLAVTVLGSSFPTREKESAKQLAKEIGVRHLFVQSNEYDVPEFSENGPDRCYYCKRGEFSKLIKLAEENGIETIVDGSNSDDKDDYRPGRRAMRELGIKSPLSDLKKADIRALCKKYGLSVFDKPSYACLASRVPYGHTITPELLGKIEKAENFLMDSGFIDVRVRDYGDLARIEVPKSEFEKLIVQAAEVTEALKDLGYLYVTMDLNGRETGSMNRVLETGKES